MATNSPIWPCRARTKAKLEILRHYLGAWFSILANKGFRHVYYVDGFCGPGEYSTGEQGSPVIAAQLASSTAQKYPGFKASLIFVDEDQKAIDHLTTLNSIKKQHPNVSIDVKIGKFSEQVDSITAELRRNPQSPTFSFIDPFGFGNSPVDQLRLLMHNERSELMINFWCGYMNRFKEHPDPAITQKIRNMVGCDDLTAVIEADDSIDAFCTAFEANLKSIGRYTLRFMMRDEGNIRDNAFFFCGRQARGFEKIKEAMWKIDPINGNSFSAHRQASANPSQQSLFDDTANTHPLSKLLVDHFRGRQQVPVSEIFSWVIQETDSYLKSHARVELENLLERKMIVSIVDPNSTGRRRAKNQWPERLLISFS